MWSRRSVVERLRWIAALGAGVPAVVLLTGALYSDAGVRGGRYGQAILLALVHGLLLWVVFRLARAERVPRMVIGATLAVACLGPMTIGHAMGYGDLRSLAHTLVREDASGRYPAEWKRLDRDALFPKWVGAITGTEVGGIRGYLRAQAAIGWEGWVAIKYRMHVERRGPWVWVAWAWHLALFLVASAVAFLAARRESPAAGTVVEARPAPRPAPPPAVPVRDDREMWSEVNEQQRTMASFYRQPRAAFPSLQDFFEARVRRSFARIDPEHREADVRSYLERVCVMQEVSRAELVGLIARHASWARPPRVPDDVRAVVLARDEPRVKEVVWETADDYWAMVWSRDDG